MRGADQKRPEFSSTADDDFRSSLVFDPCRVRGTAIRSE